MVERTNVHDLRDDLQNIVRKVHASSRQVSRVELLKKFGRSPIERLFGGGHLVEMVGRSCKYVDLTPLTKREIVSPPPWKKPEDRTLGREWQTGTPLKRISKILGRKSSDIMGRAWVLGLVRGDRERRANARYIPAWRFRRIRLSIVEAERRGLDIEDDATNLRHPVLLRRMLRARLLIASPLEEGLPRWSAPDLAALRAFAYEGRTIAVLARYLGRSCREIAHRLRLEGRSLSGTWSEEEDRIIKQGVEDGIDYWKIAKKLPGRDQRQIRARARRLCGVKARRAWTEPETKALMEGVSVGLCGLQLSSRVPTRSHHAVRRHLYKLTRESRRDTLLSPAELRIISLAYKRGKSPKEIAKWVDRPIEEVRRHLFFFKTRTQRKGKLPSLDVKQARQAARLLARGGLTVKKIAERFGVTRSSIYNAVNRLESKDWRHSRAR